MIRALNASAIALFFLSPGLAYAQSSPVGVWNNIDDKTGQPRAEIRISENDGVVSARIERRLVIDPESTGRCNLCTDDRKDQPIEGLEIIRGARLNAENGWWEGGTILDPANGKSYTLRMRVGEDGRSMQVRGQVGPFFRTQNWVRVQ